MKKSRKAEIARQNEVERILNSNASEAQKQRMLAEVDQKFAKRNAAL